MKLLLFCGALTCLVIGIVLVIFDCYFIYNLVQVIIHDFKNRDTNNEIYEGRIDDAMRMYVPLKIILFVSLVIILISNCM